ncbi:MAG: response regulator [Vicinamibacteria bacterium]|nr:response regulator [Vicinamibacteria bacterium]
MNSKRILVADDDALLRRCLQAGLTAHGFEVQTASNGPEALDRLQDSGPFDALLLDEDMPGLTGRQVAQRLHNKGSAIATLLFSGSLTMTDDERNALGVQAVLTKPLTIRKVADALRRAIAAHQPFLAH